MRLHRTRKTLYRMNTFKKNSKNLLKTCFVNLSVGIGNLTYALILAVGIVVNKIPLDLVPWRYFITRLIASMCPLVGIIVYLAIMFVIVAMSGRVEIDNQFNHLIIFCIYLTYNAFAVVGVVVGILSSGNPDRYCVGGNKVLLLSSASSTRLSMRDSWLIIASSELRNQHT